MNPIIIAVVALAAVGLVLLVGGYLKAPPDTAYIITGLGKKRILIGKAGWRMPFFTRVDKLSLRVMQVDVKTSEAVPTNEFINVTVDGVAKNNGDEAWEYVLITFALYDEQGNMIGVAKDTVDYVEIQGGWRFSAKGEVRYPTHSIKFVEFEGYEKN
jgi:hypothetical protein